MEENNVYKQQDELIQSRFEDAEEAPSVAVWGAIEKRLDDKNRKRPGFIFWLSGIALLLFTAGTIWYVQQNIELKKGIAEADSNARTGKQVLPENKTAGSEAVVNEKNDQAAETGEEQKSVPATEMTDTLPEEKKYRNQATAKSLSLREEDNPAVKATKKQTANTLTVNSKKQYPFYSEKNISNGADNTKENAEKNAADLNMGKTTGLNTMATVSPPHNELKSNDKGVNSGTVNSAQKDPEPAGAQTAKDVNRENETKREEEKKSEEQEKSEGPQKQIVLQKTDNDSIIAAAVKKEEKDSLEIKKDSAKTIAAAPAPVSKTDTIQPVDDLYKWIVSLYFSPDYYQNQVKDNSGQFAGDEKQTNRFTGGLKLSYAVLDKLSVRLGISYSELKQELEEHKIYFDRYQTEPFLFHSSLGDMAVDMATMKQGFSPLAPATITRFPLNYSYRQSVQFINVPFEVKYGFSFKRLQLSVMLGVNGQYAYHSHGELTLMREHSYQQIQYTSLDVNKLTFAGTGGISIDFNLTKRISLFLEPNARYNFTSFGKSKDVSSKPLFLVVNGGIGFHF